MNAQLQIFWPIAAMVLLVVVVACLMLRERIAEMKERRIHPQKVPSSSQMGALLQNTRAADNYKNLFEVPVLFYALCLALYATQMVSPFFVAGAWVFVALRYVHSFIHVGYNTVMHRLPVFLLGMAVLVVLWVAFFMQLAQKG